MLDVTLLGQGGMAPLPGRFLTSLMVRYQGEAILVDCGEGTQVAIRSAGLGFKQIGAICVTHFHADHMAGIPGLLLTIGNSGRTEPLVILGPKHIGRIVDCLRVISPQLPFEIRYGEITPGEALRLDDLTVSAHLVEHWITCFSYRFDLKRKRKFDPEKARALDIPVTLWRSLQTENSVDANGRLITPDEVLGPERKGLSLCYATDLRPSNSLAEFASEADLFICEGMYGDPAEKDKAVSHRHCLFTEAAGMAKKARVRELWLTHFSPSMPDPWNYVKYAAGIFPNSHVDRTQATLRFDD